MLLPSTPRCALVLLVVLPVGWSPRTRADASAGAEAKPKASFLCEPAPFRVYQRDRVGRADIPVVLDPGAEDATVVSARLSGLPADVTIPFPGGQFAGIPTGGPYQMKITAKVGRAERAWTVGRLFVALLRVL